MAVVLEPSKYLTFQRPLTRLTKVELAITNNNAVPIAFKVKTTAPKLYCVRPNAGRIEPYSSSIVQVMLQSLKEEPAPNVECKDKFLILTVPINESHVAFSSIHDLWGHVESKEKNTITQSKLRCVFAAPKNTPTIPEEPACEEVTKPIPEKSVVETAAAPTAATTTPPSSANEANEHPEQRNRQVNAANEEVIRLQNELNSYKEKLAALNESTLKNQAPQPTTQLTKASAGIPPIVALLVALLSFVAGYFILPSLS